MTIPALPAPANRATQSPSAFATATDALLGALPQFVTEVNATAATVNSQSAAAVASAASASAAPATASTSTTSVGIAVGTKNFTIQTGKNIVVGMFVTAAYDANNYMFGSVISYAGTALSINVIAVVGSGTYTAWSIALSAPVSVLNNTLSGNLAVLGRTLAGAVTDDGVSSLQVAIRALISNELGAAATIELLSTNGGGGGTGIYFRPYQGVVQSTSIAAQVQIVAVDNSFSADLLFKSKTQGVVTNPVTEKMRLTAPGNLLIGSVSDDGVNKLQVNGTASINGVKHDVLSVNGVGSLRVLKNVSAGAITSGSTAAGSALAGIYWTSGSVLTATSAPAGTWKNITGGSLGNGEFGEWLRIA